MADMTSDVIENRLRATLISALGVSPVIAAGLDRESPLFGALPELDSMAIANLLAEIEEQFDVTVDESDLDIDHFLTFGALVDYVGSLGG